MKNPAGLAWKSFSTISSCAFIHLLIATPVSAADPSAGWKVQVGGVRVVASAPNNTTDLRAFNWSAGTTVSLLLTTQEGNIVRVIRDESKITSFTDDKGTDLTSHNDYNGSTFSTWFNSNQGGERSVIIEAAGSGLPAKGATQINISGKIVLQTGSQTNRSRLTTWN